MTNATAEKVNNKLVGMKEIRGVLNGVSEATVLKWHVQDKLPIVKKGGIWIGSRKAIEEWWQDFAK